jgi:hypothetical protein
MHILIFTLLYSLKKLSLIKKQSSYRLTYNFIVHDMCNCFAFFPNIYKLCIYIYSKNTVVATIRCASWNISISFFSCTDCDLAPDFISKISRENAQNFPMATCASSASFKLVKTIPNNSNVCIWLVLLTRDRNSAAFIVLR